MRHALAAILLFSTAAWAQLPDAEEPAAPPSSAKAPAAPATLPRCDKPLPALRTPLAFAPGEQLQFDLDAMGAQAGKMSMQVQRPRKDGTVPVQVEVKTNTFFSKVRRVKASAVSYLHPKTLRPTRYTEDATENEVHRTVDVAFHSQDRSVKVDYTLRGRKGRHNYTYEQDGLDAAGAVYLMRQLPMKEGMPLCVDVYGVRRMWRLTGSVVKREHVSLPIGEFNAWFISGVAVRLDKPAIRREVHFWISDDERRLPLAAVGTLEIGAMRATLSSYSRPGEKPKQAQGKEQLKW